MPHDRSPGFGVLRNRLQNVIVALEPGTVPARGGYSIMSEGPKKQIGNSVADIEGPWREPDFESSLIARCRENWSTPVGLLSDAVLAMFIRQQFGLAAVVPESRRRVASAQSDGSELYDGQLSEALASLPSSISENPISD